MCDTRTILFQTSSSNHSAGKYDGGDLSKEQYYRWLRHTESRRGFSVCSRALDMLFCMAVASLLSLGPSLCLREKDITDK